MDVKRTAHHASNGAKIGAVYPKRMTPLHWAATCGLTKTAPVLLDNGATFNLTDQIG